MLDRIDSSNRLGPLFLVHVQRVERSKVLRYRDLARRLSGGNYLFLMHGRPPISPFSTNLVASCVLIILMFVDET